MPNLLVIVPRFDMSIVRTRDELLRAAYGESKITAPFDRKTGTAGDAVIKFFPSGKFLETQRPGGKLLKPDGLPACRRISAILCVEEIVVERYPFPSELDLLNDRGIFHSWNDARKRFWSVENEASVEHVGLVIHNPHAYRPLSKEIWRKLPQLLPIGDVMQWTDGYPINV